MIDCNQLVRELIALAEPDARASDVALEVKLADGALPVLVDVVQIQQVLLNLVRNAIDATLAVADAPRRIEIRTAAVADEYVEVSVIDSGCGLPADASERMFEPFFTTKSAGTGLGLSISRGIVRDHGGRLQCAAHEPRGAIFSFTLPLSTE
jgi:signal transduction histidine kinase